MKEEGRTAYTTFEKEIIGLYDLKILTRDLLDRIASQYRQIDVDSAGSQSLLTRDGKDLHQVCIELIDPSFPVAARGSGNDHDEYWELELEKWQAIAHRRWEWRHQRAPFLMQSQLDSAA